MNENETTWEEAVSAITQLKDDINADHSLTEGHVLEFLGVEVMKNVTYLPFGMFKDDPIIDYVDVGIMMLHLSPKQIVNAIKQTRLKAAGEVAADHFEEDHE